MNEPNKMYADEVRAATLHLLVGPWASGKTTLVPILARMLPGVVVFDWDVLLPGLSAASGTDAHADASTWRGLRLAWTAVVVSVLAGGRDVLLCGPALPKAFAQLGIAPPRCAYLDCADDVLAERLRARGSSDDEIADELAFMAALRRSPHRSVIVGDRAPEQVAMEVADWVRRDRTAM
jgi:ribose 1,5-bisphosphokinase PhnN